ncbi:hypothetical protein FML52_26280, partial [Klebsiella pneumoniae]|nr:hypothetical protein [Klebsiella pneumoniae]
GKPFPVGAGLDKPQARQAFGGFRGAALNQSRSASGVYTGLLWWHDGNRDEIVSHKNCEMRLRCVRC